MCFERRLICERYRDGTIKSDLIFAIISHESALPVDHGHFLSVNVKVGPPCLLWLFFQTLMLSARLLIWSRTL